MSWDRFIDIIQAASGVGVLLAAIAAWMAVRHAGDSARYARDTTILPAKQQHSVQIKGLLDELIKSRPLDWSESNIGPHWPAQPSIPNSVPDFDSTVLFDDLDFHLQGFQARWNEMQTELSVYLGNHLDTTKIFIDSMDSYFGKSDGEPTWTRNLLRDLWARLESNALGVPTIEIHEQSETEYHLVSPAHRVATVSTESEVEAFMTKYKEFGDKFPSRTILATRIDELNLEYADIAQTLGNLKQFIVDAQTTVIFPQECKLLGVIDD